VARLEELTPNTAVRGLGPDAPVAVVAAKLGYDVKGLDTA
jgi:hypothetical protein